jgi:hypothetical protein
MNGSWYFATREGDQGPYNTDVVAHAEINRFITEKTELAHFQQAREDEHAQATQQSGQKLELVTLDERPVLRAPAHERLHRKVHI